jgi:hypothetical protein
MNPEQTMERSEAVREAAFPEAGAFKGVETKAQTRARAYDRAKELLAEKINNLTGGMPQTVKRDHKGRRVYPKNHHEIVSAENALLAVGTNAADSIVREILTEFRANELAIQEKLGAEHRADAGWRNGAEAADLRRKIGELQAELDSLGTQQF